MKFTKLSLVAALAVSAAFAGGDIAPVEPAVEAAPAPEVAQSTIGGNVKVWYGTTSQGANKLFRKGGAFGDGYADLTYTRELTDGVTANVGMAYITTLGLEQDLVSATWANHGVANPVGDVAWINAANIAVSLPASSFLKIGRQELDTPFFFSEKWNIATNTFDAAVAGTSALPDTTLIAAWVGRGNGAAGNVVNLANQNFGGGHTSFASSIGLAKPAYAFAAINKSLPSTTLQAWYYKIPSVAKAYWLQADVANLADTGVDFGAQYAGTSTSVGLPKTHAWAVKLGYSMDALGLYGAYSKRNNVAGINISNIATGVAGNNTPLSQGGQSKLYTEAYWNYGYVGAQDAKTIALGASYDLGMAKLGAQYTNVKTNRALGVGRLKEFALTASTNVGPVNADLAYVNTKADAATKSNGTVLVMLSMPFSL